MLSSIQYSPLSSDENDSQDIQQDDLAANPNGGGRGDDDDGELEEVASGEMVQGVGQDGKPAVKKKHSKKRHHKHEKKKHRKHKHRTHTSTGDVALSTSKHGKRKSRHRRREEPHFDSKAQIMSSKPLVEYDDISETEDIDSPPFDDQRSPIRRSPFPVEDSAAQELSGKSKERKELVEEGDFNDLPALDRRSSQSPPPPSTPPISESTTRDLAPEPSALGPDRIPDAEDIESQPEEIDQRSPVASIDESIQRSHRNRTPPLTPESLHSKRRKEKSLTPPSLTRHSDKSKDSRSRDYYDRGERSPPPLPPSHHSSKSKPPSTSRKSSSSYAKSPPRDRKYSRDVTPPLPPSVSRAKERSPRRNESGSSSRNSKSGQPSRDHGRSKYSSNGRGRSRERSPYERGSRDTLPYDKPRDRSPGYERSRDRSPYERVKERSPHRRSRERSPVYDRQRDRSPYERGRERSPYDRYERTRDRPSRYRSSPSKRSSYSERYVYFT